MNDNERILQLARESISKMERAFQDDRQLAMKDQRMDIKALKEYVNTMKTVSELMRELKNEQTLMQPIEVVMGEAGRFGD